jgi:hypothetical protein
VAFGGAAERDATGSEEIGHGQRRFDAIAAGGGHCEHEIAEGELGVTTRGLQGLVHTPFSNLIRAIAFRLCTCSFPSVQSVGCGDESVVFRDDLSPFTLHHIEVLFFDPINSD